jgi:DNA-binding SARP family transcriptional activator
MTTLGRLTRSLAAAIALAAIVAGLPAALVLWGTSPVRGRLEGDALRDVAYELGSERVLVGALTIAAWIVWALFLRALVLEVVAARQANTADLASARSGGEPLRSLARGLVVWLTMTAGTIGSLSNAGTPAIASVLPPAATAQLVAVPAAATSPPAPPRADAPAPPQSPSPPATAAGARVVVNAPSDAWNLAERHLGDGLRWRELWQNNRDVVQPDGQRWTDPEATVPAGWELILPTPTPTAPATAALAGEVEVAPGDHFWKLAEQQLADTWGRPPTTAEVTGYWQDLVDANRDRLAPPGDPNLIHPGQVFVTPAVAPVPQNPAVPAQAADSNPTRTPEVADTPGPESADQRSPAPTPDTDQPAATEPGAPAGQVPAEAEEPSPAPSPDTNLPAADSGVPAGELPEAEEPSDEPDRPAPTSTTEPDPAAPAVTPAPPAEATAATPAPEAPESSAPASTPPTIDPSPTTAPTGTTPDAARASASGDVDPDTDKSASSPAKPILGVAGTMLAVALLRAWRTRRSRRAARLPASVVPPAPPASSRQAAREILTRADDAAVDRLDAALVHLAAGLRPKGGQSCVQPRLVQVTGDRVEVLLDRAEPAAPTGWRPQASGLIWTLDADVAIGPPDEDALTPMPALVTIGAGESEILIDLEAFGVVSLVGDPGACWGLARSIVLEVAARAEGTLGIEIIGHELDDTIAELSGVRVLDAWDAADLKQISSSAQMLDAGRWPHTFAARASGRGWDGWTPFLYITAHYDHPHYQAALEDVAARPGAGSAMVVAGDDSGHGLRIRLNADGTFEIPELGITGTAQQIAPETVDQVVDLLDDADNLAVAQTFDFPAPDEPLHSAATPAFGASLASDDDTYTDPDYDVLVRVCGDIHVLGGTQPLDARQTAIATYIALHGEVDTDQIRDAVWNGADVTLKRVRNVVSTTRRSLGDAIYHVDQGRLRAGDGMVTDYELIRRRVVYARYQDDPAARAETLRAALEWATSKVCTYARADRRNWAWIDLENWIATVESLIGTVACDLASLYLDLGEGDGAVWAAQRGIATTAAREQLTLLLVQGYELAGDQPAAAAALRSYLRNTDDTDTHSEPLLEAMDRHLRTHGGRAAS